MANLQTIASILKEIQAAYPNWKADESTIKVWTVYMQDLDDETLVMAIRNFISTSTHAFPPSIPEIRNSVALLVAEASGAPTALDAWDEVRRAKKPNPPGYQIWSGGQLVKDIPHQWSHPLVETCARRFGWPRFPDGENDVADRAHFTRAYENMIAEQTSKTARLPQVEQYITKQIEADRRSAFETGEQFQIAKLADRLSRGRE